MNLKNINEYLSKYIICWRIFPIYIRNLILNKKDLNDAEQNSGILLDVYKFIKKEPYNDLVALISKEYINILRNWLLN